MPTSKQSTNNDNLQCPFCGTSYYRSSFSCVSRRFYLKRLKNRLEIYPLRKTDHITPKLTKAHPELIQLIMAVCPSCHRITVRAVGIGDQYQNKHFNIYPQSDAAPLPDYVPDQIRQDYKEAMEVVNLSPNSTAMLSRRILEEVLNHFFKIQTGDLFHDLDVLRKHRHLPERTIQAIDAIRRLGNLSVHGTQNVNDVFGNVNTKGAQQIVELIRVLIHDTYVEAHLNHRLEKGVIQSAKKLNYTPHYYQDSNSNANSSRASHSYHANRSHYRSHRSAAQSSATSHRSYHSRSKSSYHSKGNSRNHSNAKWKRNNHSSWKPSSKKRSSNSKRSNYQQPRNRHSRASTPRRKKHRMNNNKSYTIIQNN